MSQTFENPTEFEHHSETNSNIIRNHYKCGCQPYEDVFTFNRWFSQGFSVKKRPPDVEKGRWGLALHSLIKTEKVRQDGTKYEYSLPVTTHVFCRCQVKRMKQ